MVRRVWTAAILLIGALVVTGCTGLQLGNIIGSGNVIATEYGFSNFEKLSISNAFTVGVQQGDNFAVRVMVNDNLKQYLIVQVQGDTLVIGMKPGIYTARTLQAEITMPRLTGVKLTGASTAALVGFSGAPSFDGNLSGAAQLTGDLSTTNTTLDISGASEVTLRGATQTLSVTASGASNLNLGDFAVESAKLDVSGATRALVNVSQVLDATASGASSVQYVGIPAQVRENTSGASSVRPR